MAVTTYKELIAWQRAMDLCVSVYQLTKTFPDSERYGLISQMRRAVVSVASNIAEGQGRGPGADFARFLGMAMGGVQEIETQLLVAQRLNIVTEQAAEPTFKLLDETGKLIRGLRKSVTSN